MVPRCEQLLLMIISRHYGWNSLYSPTRLFRFTFLIDHFVGINAWRLLSFPTGRCHRGTLMADYSSLACDSLRTNPATNSAISFARVSSAKSPASRMCISAAGTSLRYASGSEMTSCLALSTARPLCAPRLDQISSRHAGLLHQGIGASHGGQMIGFRHWSIGVHQSVRLFMIMEFGPVRSR